ncbi:MAG: L-threonylcarbamoyladenylate synthase [Bacteroidia bacterium]|jgi:tRNA threonylcarbamoyl adenosine modification protein (Sua5/YciO/YrdC/YwlC family)
MRIRLYEENVNARQLEQVVDYLRKGGVIIYPTDTVYAFGADMYNSKAIEKINRLKKLDGGANYAIICRDLSNLSDYTLQISNEVFRMMKRALPGPYTFILKANNQVPKIFHSRKKTIGIRVPNNAIALAIVEALGHPIVSSSIHDDDEIIEYTTDPDLIYEKYQDQVDLLVDGGFGDNEPSTVIDCTGDEPEVIREGKGSLDVL